MFYEYITEHPISPSVIQFAGQLNVKVMVYNKQTIKASNDYYPV